MKTRRIEISNRIERLFVISDVHSFIEPLQALDGIFAAHKESFQVVAAGDLFFGGLDPVETLEWIRGRAGEFAVMGNHDETTLRGGCENQDPGLPYNEAGAYRRLSREQIEYLRAIPNTLELTWKGKVIRVMHGHRTLDGEYFTWRATQSEALARFADPAFDLTIVGHTHYPFVSTAPNGGRAANCGATAGLILGLMREDGSISPRNNEPAFRPPQKMYSVFLSLAVEKGKLKVKIERFDYDRATPIRRLREAGDPRVEDKRLMLQSALARDDGS